MRLRRAKVGRQRMRADQSSQPAAPKFNYRNRRSETERDTGRQLQREAPRTKKPSTSRFLLQRFGLLILLVAIVISAINALTLSNTAVVRPLTAQPDGLLGNEAAYTTAANQLLANSVWNRNKLTVNTSQISQQMLKQFPELASVSVTIPLLAHKPIVYVQSAQPAVILVTPGNSFLLDTTGKVLQVAPNAGSLHQPGLPVVTDQSGLKLSVHERALPTTDVSFIQTVVAQLAAKHFIAGGLTLPAAASELDMQIAGQPYLVKFNLQSGDARQQAGTFLATIAQLQKQGVTPSKYVDVRVDGRAYYQ